MAGGTLKSKTDRPLGALPGYLEKPLWTSAAAALAYGAFCAIYIIFSDRWVAMVAGGSELHHRLQTIKGLAFVAFSATLIFMLCAILLRRVARNQVALHAQQEALVAAERRATAGLLAHSVAHDMNNVLTVGMANVELLRSHGQMDESGSEMLNDIGISFERLHQMTRRMSHVGRAPSAGQAEEADLMDLVRREVAFMRRHRASTECTLHVQGPDHLKVRIHPEGMQDLLENLLLNAAEAAPENGRVEVRIAEEAEAAVLEVHDNGPGVPPERRGQIFEALYTTKPNGLGLGLLSVKAALKQHEGRVEVLASPLGGACFRVTLPRK